MKRLIVPGILTDSLADLQEKIDLAVEFSDRVSIDVIDGLFADNLTVMPESFSQLNFHDLKVDVQLMVINPVDYLGYLHTAKVDRVFGHVEKMGNINEFLDECKALSLSPGLAFDLYTPFDDISKEQMNQASGVLLMSVKAGFSNQDFVNISDKIHTLREDGYKGDVVVDGGMNEKTIEIMSKAGANQFSVTSSIWKTDDPGLKFGELTEILNK